MKNSLLAFSFILIYSFSFGQDKIIKRKDMSVLLCKVTEIGLTDIKYKYYNNLEGPTYAIHKSEVVKIIFENGKEETFEHNDMSVIPAKNRNYKRAITTRPFSPLVNHASLGYQQALTPSRALIAEIGWIGLGVGLGATTYKGGYGRIGFRLKQTPEVVIDGMEWGYNLAGMYIQPEITFSSFKSDGAGLFYQSGTFRSSAFLISLGKQSIVGDIITFDISGSLGYELFNNSDKNEYRLRYFSHSTLGKSFPLAWKFSLSMGILLK